jgi:hypothetical protein
MNTILTAVLISTSLFGAALVGMRLRRFLPEHVLSDDTKEILKLSIGLVATMTALLLGLLVSSSKGSYDNTRAAVIQMAAKVSYLDGLLAAYGPEAAEARAQFHFAVEGAVRRMWPGEAGGPAELIPDARAGDVLYDAIQRLSPRDDTQAGLKVQAAGLAVELRQLRFLLFAQSVPSISKPLVLAVISWLVVIFLGFGLLAPSNVTASLALIVSAVSVSGAVLLIMEFDRPFSGLVRIPSEPILSAVGQVVKPGP